MKVIRHVMKIARGESDPDMEPLTQRTFCFSPSGLAGHNKMSITTMSTAANQGLVKIEQRLSLELKDLVKIFRWF